jgi:hypothetical protein
MFVLVVLPCPAEPEQSTVILLQQVLEPVSLLPMPTVVSMMLMAFYMAWMASEFKISMIMLVGLLLPVLVIIRMMIFPLVTPMTPVLRMVLPSMRGSNAIIMLIYIMMVPHIAVTPTGMVSGIVPMLNSS